MLFRFGKELFWTAFWVLAALIAAYFVLGALSTRNIPLVSSFSTWVEKYSQPRGM